MTERRKSRNAVEEKETEKCLSPNGWSPFFSILQCDHYDKLCFILFFYFLGSSPYSHALSFSLRVRKRTTKHSFVFNLMRKCPPLVLISIQNCFFVNKEVNKLLLRCLHLWKELLPPQGHYSTRNYCTETPFSPESCGRNAGSWVSQEVLGLLEKVPASLINARV